MLKKEEIRLSLRARNFKKGIYTHYKNPVKKYRVLGVAVDSETLEEMVLYQALYAKKILWVRPLKMFFEEVQVGGKKVPRFRLIQSQ